MDETAEILKQRIALYRQYLREGADRDLAVEYLRSILADERLLAELGKCVPGPAAPSEAKPSASHPS
jgi:hypothetical protein